MKMWGGVNLNGLTCYTPFRNPERLQIPFLSEQSCYQTKVKRRCALLGSQSVVTYKPTGKTVHVKV